jgi:hypothetical protein
VEGGTPMRHYNLENWKNYLAEDISNTEKDLMEEHMAGCDKCTDLYLQALESSEHMLAAPEFLTDKIMDSINTPITYKLPLPKKNASLGMFMRYAVAACISMLLWQLGVFPEFGQKMSEVENFTQQKTVFNEVLKNDLKNELSRYLNIAINKMDLKGDN